MTLIPQHWVPETDQHILLHMKPTNMLLNWSDFMNCIAMAILHQPITHHRYPSIVRIESYAVAR